jgi:uncharacterized protein YcbK (DUF882 family)
MFFTRRTPPVYPAADHDTACLHRRRLLKGMAGAATLIAMPDMANAMIRSPSSKTRSLAFNHTHTGEQVSLVYRIGDRYVPDGLKRLSYLMRDFRSGDVHQMDPSLMDVLWQVQANLRTHQPFEIISAYRSPKTNAMLRGRSAHSGVAQKSMHLTGQAIDIRLPGVDLSDVRDAALDLKRGGVGYYADSGFVHIDTGRVRRW